MDVAAWFSLQFAHRVFTKAKARRMERARENLPNLEYSCHKNEEKALHILVESVGAWVSMMCAFDTVSLQLARKKRNCSYSRLCKVLLENKS